ncbi:MULTISPECIES: hypothetical protein [Streptomyces]|uniref:Uncharacterized protein n=1 Tax=Streptomyces umbrinus TaxID=67370 RepID=A0ABU0TF17_9ACTN|nr:MULTISPECIES: hypothetical protein [Streptomyces]MDQ1033581.1 hypothetical protein [Streptomyces umbrinus]TRO57092.1 hypothetical protein E4K73_44110 [Streptomyces sp. IB201691-2A2]
MRLVNSETGAEIAQGALLHMASGPSAGQAWRFERLMPHPDGHRVHVTRTHPRMGRVHREFHPRIFGAQVEIDVRWYREVGHAAHHAWAKGSDYLLAGLFALVPLALFEHFHWAGKIAEVLTLGGH